MTSEVARPTIQSLATMGGRVPMQFHIPGTGGAMIRLNANSHVNVGNPAQQEGQQGPVSSREAMLGLGLGSFEQTSDR